MLAGLTQCGTTTKLTAHWADKAYQKASGLGRLYVPYEDGNEPIAERVARHVTTVKLLADNLEYVREGKGIVIEGLPGFQELADQGVGAWLSE